MPAQPLAISLPRTRPGVRLPNGFCGLFHVGSRDTGILASRTANTKLSGGVRNALFYNVLLKSSVKCRILRTGTFPRAAVHRGDWSRACKRKDFQRFPWFLPRWISGHAGPGFQDCERKAVLRSQKSFVFQRGSRFSVKCQNASSQPLRVMNRGGGAERI